MICTRCGTQIDNGARVCPHCGRVLDGGDAGAGGSVAPHGAVKGGASAIRQGRTQEPPPVYGTYDEHGAQAYWQDAGRPGDRRGVDVGREGAAGGRRLPRHDAPARSVQRRGVNTALLGTIALGLLLVALVVLFVLAIRLPQGHTLLLRFAWGNEERTDRVISLIGEENAAAALWKLGAQEHDEGHVSRAITLYTRAYALNPEIDGLYDRLLNLANAYEATGQLESAEAVYALLYGQVDETNPLAYRYAISLLNEQNRLFEATALMQTAYEKTGELSFKSQREQLVPLPPTATLVAGRYMLERSTALVSPQDYDIYYVVDDLESELPENGQLFSEDIYLSEGSHVVRAVCVSANLVSDEVQLEYTIYYPTPSAPKSRLLTGEYDTRRRIYLYMEEERDGKAIDTPNQEITIYYTIDGTAPNSESPIYTDEGFLLPAGKCTVRAVAVNQYGMVSNEYTGTYRVNQKFKTFFRDEDDQFRGVTVGKTSYSAFQRDYGAGTEETVAFDGVRVGQALRVAYGWGEACFSLTGQTLLSLSTNYASMTGPRGTKVGMTAEQVTEQFRDMGQVANARGNRSLYYDEATGYGRYYQDSETEARIEYVYLRPDGGTTTLTYELREGVVSRISMTVANAEIE